jgi:ABC-type sugar transport system substrate-binding protein
VMDDLMTRGIKALVISPLDKDASANAVRAARAQHLPIVEYNTFFADRAIATNSVGVDNKELAASVGREMDKSIKAHMDGHARIGLIPLPSINPGSSVRKQGMLSALTDVQVDIVSEIEGATPEQGANAVESILRRDLHGIGSSWPQRLSQSRAVAWPVAAPCPVATSPRRFARRRLRMPCFTRWAAGGRRSASPSACSP